MVNVGGIVNVGGFGGSSGGGSTSGITDINGQTGPSITLVGTSGIIISPVAPNLFNVGFAGSILQSGVLGVNGINVEQVGGSFVIDGAAISGINNNCFSQQFAPTTSGRFNHNLNTRDLVIQVLDAGLPPRVIFPDAIIHDTLDTFSVIFNSLQAGTVIATSCGGSQGSTSTSQRVELDLEFKEAFNSNTYAEVSRVSGQLSQIDIWETALKSNKLFTKAIARVSGQVSQVTVTCEQTASTLVTDIGRDVSGILTTITKTYTP
jgi:hypothetical protein